MSLSQAVDLVEFGLTQAEQGDTFFWKAPICTIDELVAAMMRIFTADSEAQIIGIHYGKKLFEAPASSKKLRRCADLGDYLQVRLDGRNLNCGELFDEGDPGEIAVEDYTSRDTTRLAIPEVQKLLLSLPEIRRSLEEARL